MTASRGTGSCHSQLVMVDLCHICSSCHPITLHDMHYYGFVYCRSWSRGVGVCRCMPMPLPCSPERPDNPLGEHMFPLAAKQILGGTLLAATLEFLEQNVVMAAFPMG